MKASNGKDFLVSFSALLILTFTFLFVFYGSILRDPNSHFFKDSGDGLKNYFTYAYYIDHNISNSNFEGMNYPYGEHFLYTDCNPVIAISLKKLSILFPGIKEHSVGILNMLMLLSLVMTSIILFLIFHKLKINYLLSVLGALAIMMLSPQLFRFGGHYALSYSFFIPLTIYLLLRFEFKNQSYLLALLLTLSNLFFLFIHAYLGIILISFLLLYLILKMILERLEWKQNVKAYLQLLFSIAFPILFFLLFLSLSDTHIGRTSNAGNLIGHSANFFTLLFPFKIHPFYPFFAGLFPNTDVPWEDLSYIGLVNDLVLVFLFYFLVKTFIVSGFKGLKRTFLANKFLSICFLSSIILLLFAMDFPFAFGFDYLLDLDSIEIIKNFRANGRFAWVFYFVFGILAVFIINKLQEYLSMRNKKMLATICIISYSLLLMADGFIYNKHVANVITKSPNLFNTEQLDPAYKEALSKIEKGKYQAIIPLPFFESGSGNFIRTTNKTIFRQTIICSYHSGVPIMGAHLTRISIPESKKLIQVFSNGFYEKEIADDIKDDRPFLIIKSNEKISKNEREYLEKSQLIYKNKDFSFYEIQKAILFENTSFEEWSKFNSIESDLIRRKGFLVNDSSSYFFYDDFETKRNEISYRGKGALSGSISRSSVLTTVNGNDLDTNSRYIASIWVYNCGENFGQDLLNFRIELSMRSGKKENWKTPFISPNTSQIINDCWSLVELPFSIKEKNADYDLRIVRKEDSDIQFTVDDLLIYKDGMKIYRIDEGGSFLFMNNHKINKIP